MNFFLFPSLFPLYVYPQNRALCSGNRLRLCVPLTNKHSTTSKEFVLWAPPNGYGEIDPLGYTTDTSLLKPLECQPKKTPSPPPQPSTTKPSKTFPYQCLRCQRTYKSAHSLKRHCLFECAQTKQFCCRMCNHKVNRSDRLLEHMRSVHSMSIAKKKRRSKRKTAGRRVVR